MTNEQIEIELKHLATKEDLGLTRSELKSDILNLRAELYKVKSDLIQMQFTSTGIILVGIGLMIHFKI